MATSVKTQSASITAIPEQWVRGRIERIRTHLNTVLADRIAMYDQENTDGTKRLQHKYLNPCDHRSGADSPQNELCTVRLSNQVGDSIKSLDASYWATHIYTLFEEVYTVIEPHLDAKQVVSSIAKHSTFIDEYPHHKCLPMVGQLKSYAEMMDAQIATTNGIIAYFKAKEPRYSVKNIDNGATYIIAEHVKSINPIIHASPCIVYEFKTHTSIEKRFYETPYVKDLLRCGEDRQYLNRLLWKYAIDLQKQSYDATLHQQGYFYRAPHTTVVVTAKCDGYSESEVIKYHIYMNPVKKAINYAIREISPVILTGAQAEYKSLTTHLSITQPHFIDVPHFNSDVVNQFVQCASAAEDIQRFIWGRLHKGMICC